MACLRAALLAAVLALLAGPAAAQVLLTGRVSDASTGEPLGAASVQIEGTYTGTITNAEGAFELRAPALPAVLVIRFIGYETARLEVGTAGPVAVALVPAVVEGPEVTVTGENPAEGIMRRVIERKQAMQEGLHSWRAEAYVRQVIRRDTAIAGILEGVTVAYWRRGHGIREVVQGVRRTENLPDFDAAFVRAAEAVTNLYDDEIAFAGYDLMGPTAPGALAFYAFTLEGFRYLDDRIVYDIALQPRSRLQPGFSGRLAVLSGEYVLLEATLRPNEVVRLPLVSDLEAEFRQQFSAFGREAGGIWLPVDYRFSASARLAMPGLAFPGLGVRTVARLSDYAVNVAVPDSLFAEAPGRAVVDSAAVAADTALARAGVVVPLEPLEAAAYARLDSTDTLEEAFQPSGVLARFVKLSAGRSASDRAARASGLALAPQLWFNRVEALHAGGAAALPALGPLRLSAGAGYSTGLEAATYEGRLGLRLPLGRGASLAAAAGYRREHARRGGPSAYGRLVPAAAALLGEPDYFDYYRRRGFFAEAGVRLRPLEARLTASLLAERHEALPRTTDYDLFGRLEARRENPAIPEGRLHALGLEVELGRLPRDGGLGLSGGRGLVLRLEAGRPGVLGGDFDYRRAEGVLLWRQPTLLRRRLFPLTLDLRLAGGLSAGALPPQRRFTIDGTVLALAPAGALRTVRGRFLEGDRYAVLAWEHDFRSVPFELLGLGALAERQIGLLVHGAHGRTWLEAPPEAPVLATEGWHHELGLSLSGGFFIPVRLDLSYRFGGPGLFVSLGAARLF